MLLPRGQIHIAQGASGSGKTTILMQAIQAWQLRQQFPIEFDTRGVAYVVADRNEKQVKDLANRLGLNIEIYSFVGDFKLSIHMLDDPDALLTHCMSQFKKPYDLLVLDPLMPFMKSSNLDYRGVMKSLIPFSRMATKRNLAILGVCHSTKTRTDFKFARVQDRISGSSAFSAYSDTQIALVEGIELGEPTSLLEITSHTAPRVSYRLIRNEQGFFEVLDERRALLGKLRGAFETDEASTSGLLAFAQNNGVPRSTVFNWINKLEKEGKLTKTKRGIYKLPERSEGGLDEQVV